MKRGWVLSPEEDGDPNTIGRIAGAWGDGNWMRRRMPLVGQRFESEDGDLTSSTLPCNAHSESADDFRQGFTILEYLIILPVPLRLPYQWYSPKHSNLKHLRSTMYNSRLIMITVNHPCIQKSKWVHWPRICEGRVQKDACDGLITTSGCPCNAWVICVM